MAFDYKAQVHTFIPSDPRDGLCHHCRKPEDDAIHKVPLIGASRRHSGWVTPKRHT